MVLSDIWVLDVLSGCFKEVGTHGGLPAEVKVDKARLSSFLHQISIMAKIRVLFSSFFLSSLFYFPHSHTFGSEVLSLYIIISTIHM